MEDISYATKNKHGLSISDIKSSDIAINGGICILMNRTHNFKHNPFSKSKEIRLQVDSWDNYGSGYSYNSVPFEEITKCYKYHELQDIIVPYQFTNIKMKYVPHMIGALNNKMLWDRTIQFSMEYGLVPSKDTSRYITYYFIQGLQSHYQKIINNYEGYEKAIERMENTIGNLCEERDTKLEKIQKSLELLGSEINIGNKLNQVKEYYIVKIKEATVEKNKYIASREVLAKDYAVAMLNKELLPQHMLTDEIMEYLQRIKSLNTQLQLEFSKEDIYDVIDYIYGKKCHLNWGFKDE